MGKEELKIRIQTLFNTYFEVIEFLYKFKEGNLMINLAIGPFLLTLVLVNYGASLTANIYS